VLDLAPVDGSDPVTNHATVERELADHDPRLAALPRVLALSKADLVPAADAAVAAREWTERLGAAVPVLVTSSATGEGVDALAVELARRVPLGEASDDGAATVPAPGDDELPEHRTFRPAAGRGFTVARVGKGAFRVTGLGIDRLVARYDHHNEEAMAHLEGRLRGIGVIRALRDAGFQPGDDVEIGGTVFELEPGEDL
jgi:GTP-binding protein